MAWPWCIIPVIWILILIHFTAGSLNSIHFCFYFLMIYVQISNITLYSQTEISLLFILKCIWSRIKGKKIHCRDKKILRIYIIHKDFLYVIDYIHYFQRQWWTCEESLLTHDNICGKNWLWLWLGYWLNIIKWSLILLFLNIRGFSGKIW